MCFVCMDVAALVLSCFMRNRKVGRLRPPTIASRMETDAPRQYLKPYLDTIKINRENLKYYVEYRIFHE